MPRCCIVWVPACVQDEDELLKQDEVKIPVKSKPPGVTQVLFRTLTHAFLVFPLGEAGCGTGTYRPDL